MHQRRYYDCDNCGVTVICMDLGCNMCASHLCTECWDNHSPLDCDRLTQTVWERVLATLEGEPR